MKNKGKKLITFMAIILLFITAFKEVSFAEEQAQGDIPGPTDVEEGVLWENYPLKKIKKSYPWYTDEILQSDIQQGRKYGLIKEHGREYFVVTWFPGDLSSREYYFTDAKVAADTLVYSSAWLPDVDQVPYAGFFMRYPIGHDGSSPYSSSKTPYQKYNAYRSDENAVFITGFLNEYGKDAPETIVVPRTIGGKSVNGIWLTGEGFNLFVGGPKTIYLPKDCGIISGEEYWRGDRPQIIRY